MVLDSDPVGSRAGDRRIVPDDDVVEGLWPVGLERYLNNAGRLVQKIERILPKDSCLIVVAVPPRDHRISHWSTSLIPPTESGRSANKHVQAGSAGVYMVDADLEVDYESGNNGPSKVRHACSASLYLPSRSRRIASAAWRSAARSVCCAFWIV